MSLIDTIKSDLLKSCELTGMWEKKLRMIERGEYDADTFIRELKQQLAAIIDDVRSDIGNGGIEPPAKVRKQPTNRKRPCKRKRK